MCLGARPQSSRALRSAPASAGANGCGWFARAADARRGSAGRKSRGEGARARGVVRKRGEEDFDEGGATVEGGVVQRGPSATSPRPVVRER